MIPLSSVSSGTILLLNAPDVFADVVLGELLKNVSEGETSATVKVRHNDIDKGSDRIYVLGESSFAEAKI